MAKKIKKDYTGMVESWGHRKFSSVLGLERESVRVTEDGFLAASAHPFTKPEFDPASFDRDFAECQTELVTPVSYSSMDLYGNLLMMHKQAVKRLKRQDPREYLWVYSNPPYIGENIPVAQFTGDLAWKTKYREYLTERYGSHKQLFSGIHYNFSFPNFLIPKKEKNAFYMNLARNVYIHAYLPVMLLSASPVYDSSFDYEAPGTAKISDAASIRVGENGYWNPETLYLDFSSVEAYAASAGEHVKKKEIMYTSEIYLPVRIKSTKTMDPTRYAREGIDYVEFRSVDINPFDEAGIDYRDLEFLHLFMIYMASLPEIELTKKRQDVAMHDVKEAAMLHPSQKLVDCACAVLEDMYRYFEPEKNVVWNFLDYEMAKLVKPEYRYSSKIITEYGENYVEAMLESFRRRQK